MGSMGDGSCDFLFGSQHYSKGFSSSGVYLPGAQCVFSYVEPQWWTNTRELYIYQKVNQRK